MDFTLDQLLAIIGRLDDSQGFDTPRERFRRFLQERMTALEPARLLIQQCREQSGEQSHRSLQDVLALFGRLLGFETAFRPYQHDPGDMPIHGTWQVRHRLHISVIVCTDQTPEIDLVTIASRVAAGDARGVKVGLLIVTPLYAGRDRLGRLLASGKYPNLRLTSLAGLLRLATLVEERHLTPDDVLQVFDPAVSLDAQVEVLERVVTAARPESAFDTILTTLSDRDLHDRRYWVTAMRVGAFTATERVVRSLIGTRQILGINPVPGVEDRVRIGDAICVFIAGRGIVAHATIAGILTDGSRIIRHAKRYTHVLRLTEVRVYDAPVVPTQELGRKLDLALSEDSEAVTVSISPREHESITALAGSERDDRRVMLH